MKRYLVVASLSMMIGFSAVAMEPAEPTRQEKKDAERQNRRAERQKREELRLQKKSEKRAKAEREFEKKRPAQLTQDVDMPRNSSLYSAPLAIRSRSGKTVYYQNGQPMNPEMRRAQKPRPDKLEEVVERTEPETTEDTDGYDSNI